LALTRLSRTGEKYVETGIGHGVKTRSNSWYDEQLVIREGEDILEAIDTRGIETLRRHKLVWSGWQPYEDLVGAFAFQEGQGFRLIQIPSPGELQLFFLSLLWRAAASSRHEFADFKLPSQTLEDLRVRVLQQSPGLMNDYPVQLFQLADRGVEHNRTPLLERKRMEPSVVEVDYARFYFDGLCAHIHMPQGLPMEPHYLRTCLGGLPDGQTIVFGHRFKDSRAWKNIEEVASTVASEGTRGKQQFCR
jgi:hypothetical protein